MTEKKDDDKPGKKYDGGAIPKLSKKEADEARKEAEEKESSAS